MATRWSGSPPPRPPGTRGGPERLVAYVVLDGPEPDPGRLMGELQSLLGQRLNPLYRLSEVVPVASLPRTASNKVICAACSATEPGWADGMGGPDLAV